WKGDTVILAESQSFAPPHASNGVSASNRCRYYTITQFALDEKSRQADLNFNERWALACCCRWVASLMGGAGAPALQCELDKLSWHTSSQSAIADPVVDPYFAWRSSTEGDKERGRKKVCDG
ncbi:hypothetical protein CORC01_14256, partial [Colletotrichum orchidophilum]